MPEREQKHRTSERSEDESQAQSDSVSAATPNERVEKIKADLDDLLDESDGVLEENAEEFVRNYVQKGGQ